MSLNCPRCSKTIEFSGERPRFCAFCGSALEVPVPSPVVETLPYGAPSDETREYVPPARPREDETWPERVATYDLVRLLGRGGMGAVFEAQERESGRRVALKLIAHDRIDSPEALERFRQEGRLASTVSHPRCVFVLAADEADGRPYIVMELMPGTTLHDLVERDGPMSVEQAVPRVLDVIDGLIEAHGLGVIHRDVKPSNCFIDDDGRTKIGDFGLSKSLGGSSNLTRTGAFLGTPLYASPEQIKGEPIDERTDVYSVAATLYYLLAGRPPFQGTDAAATLARIVSEPMVPLRSARPDVPLELELIIQRGMARDRSRRYKDLAELREALAPFAPGRLAPATPSRRVAAYLLDAYVPPMAVALVLQLVFFLATRGRRPPSLTQWTVASTITDLLVMLFSFGMLEAFTGASPGKWLMGLRVWGQGGLPASPRAVWLRTLIFFLVASLPYHLWSFLDLGEAWVEATVGLTTYLLPFALFIPTSKATGYRGWHEKLSGTRVVRLPRSARRRAPVRRRPVGKGHHDVARPIGVLRAIGPYKVRGAVKWDTRRKVLAAEDPGLGRECWVVLRPKGSEPPQPWSRDLARDTRIRWLGGGEQGDNRWDAYTAPGGCSLADLAGAEGLSWADALPLLEDLATELCEAIADGTLPPALDLEMVWVEPDGTAILVDALANPEKADDRPPEVRALDLLRQATRMALEGGHYRQGEGQKTVRAAIPLSARAVVDRLFEGPDRYMRPEAFRDDLAALETEVAEVDRTARALHLAVQMVFLLPYLAMILSLSSFLMAGLYKGYGEEFEKSLHEEGFASVESFTEFMTLGVATLVVVAVVTWVVWGAFTRGGISLKLTGLALARHDGRPAGMVRCGLRALIVWLPVACLILMTCWALTQWSNTSWTSWIPFVGAILLLLAYVPLALYRPRRGPHDWLAGTVIVPR
jgi:uncharacterized RDD family membrane protein YckC